MTKKLPIGVSTVKNRPNLYRFSVMINGKRHSEYYRLDDGLTARERVSVLQKAVDEYRRKCELGTEKGKITDKTPFNEAVAWFLSQKEALGGLRSSTIRVAKNTFDTYVLPRFGHLQIRQVTSSMITAFNSDMLTNGGSLISRTTKRRSPRFKMGGR